MSRRPGERAGAHGGGGSQAVPPEGDRWVLRLFVTGVSRSSANAVERVRALCEEHLGGRYDLEVIDIYQLPALARGEQIVATPTLIRVSPAPTRRYIGNLSRDALLGFTGEGAR